jgi:uncharacterized protein (TIGR02996 family)
MNDHDALLRAIGEHPEEDTPRLMYADWLDEHGQPERADFVRNQVELARPGLSAAERFPLVKKNVYYLAHHVRGWKAELPRVDGVEWGDFNRGLIEEVQADSEDPVVRHAKTIFAVPGVHVLRLRRLIDGRALAHVLRLDQLRALRMVGARADAVALLRLLVSPHLTRLQVLDLHGNRADDAVAVILDGSRFADLVELWLGSNQIGEAGARALADSRHLDRLRLIDLRGNALTAARAALVRTFGSRLKI